MLGSENPWLGTSDLLQTKRPVSIQDIKSYVPPEFHQYLSVFNEKQASRFPASRPWDHHIELKPGFKPSSSKVYPLNPEEDKLTKEFIDDNLAKGDGGGRNAEEGVCALTSAAETDRSGLGIADNIVGGAKENIAGEVADLAWRELEVEGE